MADVTALPASFRRTALTNYANTLTTIVVALLTVPLLTRGLGVEAYGVWVLVGASVLYLELLEFGFGATTIRFVAAARAQDDDEGVRTAIATSFWILAVPGVAAAALAAGLAVGFPRLFDVSPELVAPAQVLLLLLGLDLAVSLPSDCFGGTLIALQRYDLLNLSLIAVTALQAVGWAVVIATGGGLVELGAVTVVLALAGQLWRYLMVRRLVPGLSLSPRRVTRELVKPYAGTSWWYSLSEVSEVLIARIDTIVVGALVSVPAAGVYVVGQKLALLAERTSRPVLVAFFPHSATLSAQGDDEGLRQAAALGTRIATAVTLPLALVLVLFSRPAVEVWVGPRFADAAVVLALLAGATAVDSLGVASRLLLYGSDGLRGSAVVKVVEALLNLVLSLVLGARLGLEGVALATLVAAALTTCFGMVPHAARTFGFSQSALYASVLRAHLVPAAAATATGLLLLPAEGEGLLPLLACAGATGLVYLCLLALTGASGEERRAVRDRLRARTRA